MSRRSFLRFLAGAPVAASAAVIANNGYVSQLGEGFAMKDGAGMNPVTSPIEQAYWRAREMRQRKKDAMRTGNQYLPAHISGKRSWSEVYKRSVYAKEAQEEFDLFSYDVTDTEQMIRALKKVGFEF